MACSRLLSAEDLSRFRTKQCRRLIRGGCDFGLDRCQYSHNEYWNRRCPFYLSDSSFIRYIPFMCENVSVGEADDTIKNDCTRGGECPFAHSNEEILYHPLFYKTRRCEKYLCGQCDTYYCPYVHGLAETRTPGMFKLPFTQGIDVPPLPGVAIVEKIEYASNSSSQNFRHNAYQRRNPSMLPSLSNDSVAQSGLGCSRAALPSAISPISHRSDLFQGFRRSQQHDIPSCTANSDITADVNIFLRGRSSVLTDALPSYHGCTAATALPATAKSISRGTSEESQHSSTSASNAPATLNSFTNPSTSTGFQQHSCSLVNGVYSIPPLHHQVESSLAMPAAADIITAKYMRVFNTESRTAAGRVNASNVAAAVLGIESQRRQDDNLSGSAADSPNNVLKDQKFTLSTDTAFSLNTLNKMNSELLLDAKDSTKSFPMVASDETKSISSQCKNVDCADTAVGQSTQKSNLQNQLSSGTCSTDGSASENEDRVSQASGEMDIGSVVSCRQSSGKTTGVYTSDDAVFLKVESECPDTIAAIGSVDGISFCSNSDQLNSETNGSSNGGGVSMAVEASLDRLLVDIATELEAESDCEENEKQSKKQNNSGDEQTHLVSDGESSMQQKVEESVSISGSPEIVLSKKMKRWELLEKEEQAFDDDGGNAEAGMAAVEVLRNLASLNLALDVHAHPTEHFSATQWDEIACATYELLGVVELHRHLHARNTLSIWPLLRNGVSFLSEDSPKSIADLGPNATDPFPNNSPIENSPEETIALQHSPVFSTPSSVHTRSDAHHDLGVTPLPQDLSFALAWSPPELLLLNSNHFGEVLEEDVTRKAATLGSGDTCLHYTFESGSSLYSCSTGCSEESDRILPGMAALSLRMKDETMQEGTV